MKRPTPPTPLPLLDAREAQPLSPEDARTAQTLSRLAEPVPDRVAQERVWRAVAAGLPVQPRRARWLLVSAAAVAVALISVALPLALRASTGAPLPRVAHLALTAGHVLSAEPRREWAKARAGLSLPEASRLRTEDQSRTVAVLGDSQILLSGGSDLGLESFGASTFLRLSQGEVVCQVAPRKAGETFVVQTTRYRVTVKGTIFAVRQRAEDDVDVSVSRGLVEVTGAEGRWMVPAGSAWHSRTPDAPAADDIAPEQRSLLEQASGGSATEPHALISVEGEEGLQVSEGGMRLGPTPVSWDAPVGTYHFVGTAAAASVGTPTADGNVVTVANTQTTVVLKAPPAAEAVAAPAPVPAPAPEALVAPEPAAPARHKRSQAFATPQPEQGPLTLALSPGGGEGMAPASAPAPAPSSGMAAPPAPVPAPTPDVLAAPLPAPLADAPRTPAPPLLARLDPSELQAPTRTPTPQVAAPGPAKAADPYPAALALARSGDPLFAAGALQSVADARGPHADLALYELGRLRQQKLADPQGALAAYRAYEKDYPRGSLSQEVQLSAIEIELQQEDLTSALSEIDRFLDAHGKSERAPEVHLLRGDVLTKRGDTAAALREYQRAADQGLGEVAAEGLYRTAACEERLGDTEGAASALRDYLKRYPAGPHASAASAALSGSTRAR